jgi:hypothetical protein
VPVAQPLGPPEPAAAVMKALLVVAVVLLQKPLLPYGVAYPAKFETSQLAQESFHGISGM